MMQRPYTIWSDIGKGKTFKTFHDWEKDVMEKELTVGKNGDYATVPLAEAAAKPGDTIVVLPEKEHPSDKRR